MPTEIIVAIVGLVSSVLVQFGGIIINSKLTNYRIEQLEHKVERFNHFAERVHNLETHNTLQDEKIAVANHRISDLEKKP